MSQLHPATIAALEETDRLAGSMDTLFTGTATGDQVTALISAAKRDFHLIGRQQEQNAGAAIIAVVGPKNSGKSWLCRSLLSDPRCRGQIASGLGRQATTSKVLWIGEPSASRPGTGIRSAPSGLPQPNGGSGPGLPAVGCSRLQ